MRDPEIRITALFEQHASRLLVYARRQAGSADAEDLVSEAFVVALERLDDLPSETLAAALQVLADVDGVVTTDVTVQGRPAVEITYSSFWGWFTGRNSITVDRETARVASESQSDPGGTYEVTTTLVEVVDEIPEGVRTDFQRVDPGVRVFD